MKLPLPISMGSRSAFRPFENAEIEQSIPERFEAQVRAHGNRLAIRWDGGSCRYSSLNVTANRLARAILARRGESAEPVALLFDHAGDVLAAIIAVLKAGKFYVVLDPSYPPDRLKYMLDDSGAKLMVADANHLDHARQLCANAVELIDFDGVDQHLSGANLATRPLPDSLAMILYTSGSTGRPKGVMHNHRNVLVDVRNFTNGWHLTARDRWLLSASLSFANSVRTIYSSLLNGASLFPYDLKREGFGKLVRWLLDNEITIIRGVPTFFRNFVAALDASETFPSVRVLSLGGEPMLRAAVGHFNRHFLPHCVLAHGFGPTECLTVSWLLVPHGTPITSSKLAIGQTLPDKDVLLLDESRREVDVGEVGEIAVRSRHISPGYWGDAERTRAAFPPELNGGDTRTYLTGDFGLRTEDGTLIHVGRRDFQVKIRGYRIDVSEIEYALRATPGVSDAVVVGREWVPGDLRLVAYFVASPGSAVSESYLRAELARVLPDYMVPSAFVAMESIPQTPNGKTDRLRLPLPGRGSARRGLDAPSAPPGTPIEIELAALWAEILGLEFVGVDETFVDLGGDSLQAANLAARVAARFKHEIPPSAMFTATTVATMASVIAPAASATGAGIA